MPPPSFDDLRRFCTIDGWEQLERIRGGAGDHHRYRKILRDGTILRTRVSHGRGKIRAPGLWRHIWHDQLGLTSEDEFWQALRARGPVQRGSDIPKRPTGRSIPAWVVAGLLQAGMVEAEIRALDAGEAQRRLQET